MRRPTRRRSLKCSATAMRRTSRRSTARSASPTRISATRSRSLTSGAHTNDTDLTVQVSLTGTGALAGDTVQLYNGSTTASQLGTSYTLTATDITNGFANVQTGTLTDGTTYAITARVTDSAGNQSGASGSFTVTEDTTAPAAPTSPPLDPTTASGTGGHNKAHHHDV